MNLLLLPPGRISEIPLGISVTERQFKAVRHLAEYGGSKGDALRAAGYSEQIARNPQKVFGSPGVQELLEAAGIDPVETLQSLKSLAKARRYMTRIFPPYLESDERAMTDEEIIETLESVPGYHVHKISARPVGSGENGMAIYERVVHLSYPSEKTRLDATEKIINLFGIYAPKKLDVKGQHEIGVTSLKELRRLRQEKGIRVIDQIPEAIEVAAVETTPSPV